LLTTTFTRTAETNDARNSDDATKVLSECCEVNAACRLQFAHNGYSARATFVALRPQGIELRLSAEENDEPLLPQAICCVSFPYKTTFCAFLGKLDEVHQLSSGGCRVVATTPKQLTTTNLRQSFRVPVNTEAGLVTTVRMPDDQAFVVQTRDIAESGLEIEFSRKDHPELTVGATLIAELQFRGEVVQRKCEVRRVAGKQCGLLFCRQPNEDEQRPADRMNGMLLSLQQLWLKSRVK
jgi:hypothetical protein